MKDRLNCGHSIYRDNFYNSLELGQESVKNETYCTGTLRTDGEGNPKLIVSMKLSNPPIVVLLLYTSTVSK